MDNTNYPINQHPYINQNATASRTKNPNKPCLIILSILSFLIVILGATNVAIYLTRNNDANVGTNTPEANNNVDDIVSSTAFEDLTKEQALAFLRAQTDITGTLPKNYVGEEISNAVITSGTTIINDIELIYSYDTIDDLKEMANERYSDLDFFSSDNTDEYDENNYEIKEYDYYAIVTPKRTEKSTPCDYNHTSDCDSLLSFKRSYLDYHQEETTPTSFNDAYYLNTQNPDIINYLLRVYSFFSGVGFGSHGNIYSYKFEEEDDKYVLTVNNVGAGINSELLKNPDKYTNDSEIYGINLYFRRFAADKSDGRIYTIPTETGVTEDVKSFPITEEELRSLPGYND